MSHAARALSAFESGEDEAALAELCELWRESRAPDVAEAIDLLSAKVAPPRVPPGKSVADRDAAWRKLEEELRPAALGRMLETFLDVPTKWVAPRIARLDSRWPDDPRIAMALARMMEATYAKGATSYRLWRGFVLLLTKQADPRTLPVLEKLDRAHRGDRPVAVTAALNRSNLFARTIHLIRQKLQGFSRPLLKDEAAAVAKIRASFASMSESAGARAKTVEDFLAEIRAHPHDDGLRSVFADWLLEQGDERGEFISLQLSGARTAAAKRRVNELLRAHEREWLGAIEPVILKDGLVYERGFPSRVRTKCKSMRLAHAMVGKAEWATVREIDLFGWQIVNRLEVAMHPVMRSLDAVHGAEVSIVKGGAELPWRELTLQGGELSMTGSVDEAIAEVVACTRFPRLEVLSIDATRLLPEKARVLWAGAIAKRLKSFGLTLYTGYHNSTPRDAIARWLKEVAGGFETMLERFSVAWDRADGWRVTLTRDANARMSRASADFVWPVATSPLTRNGRTPIEELASHVAGAKLTRLEVRARKHVGTGLQLAAFRKACADRGIEAVLDVPDPDARDKESA